MNCLIVGATSGIASRVAECLACSGHTLVLLARDEERATILAAHLQILGATRTLCLAFEATQPELHATVLRSVIGEIGDIDLALVAHGVLPDEDACRLQPEELIRSANINFTSAVVWLSLLGEHMRQRGSGCLVGISSVAGDRGRASNYAYGAAKAGITAFLSGLRAYLSSCGVKVITVKPGIVNTEMTAHIQKKPFAVAPEVVADGILRAVESGQDEVYLPRRWRMIMLIIRCIPEFIFKKMRF